MSKHPFRLSWFNVCSNEFQWCVGIIKNFYFYTRLQHFSFKIKLCNGTTNSSWYASSTFFSFKQHNIGRKKMNISEILCIAMTDFMNMKCEQMWLMVTFYKFAWCRIVWCNYDKYQDKIITCLKIHRKLLVFLFLLFQIVKMELVVYKFKYNALTLNEYNFLKERETNHNMTLAPGKFTPLRILL